MNPPKMIHLIHEFAVTARKMLGTPQALACVTLISCLAAPSAHAASLSLGGTWNGAVLEARRNCNGATNNGDHGTYAQYDIGVGGGVIEIAQSGITGLRCTYSGSYSENGADKNGSGTFTCTDGKRGTWLATGMLVTENEMSLKFSEQLNTTETCTINAVLGGSRLTPLASQYPSIDYTGAWYNRNEAGWGVSVVKGTSTTLGIIIYHYDPNRAPVWFILQNGVWQNPTTFSGALYRYAGPPYSDAFNAALVSSAPAGSATLSFASATQADITYTIGATTQTRSIEKLSF